MKYNLFYLFVFLLLISCKGNSTSPVIVDLIENGDFEEGYITPSYWYVYSNNESAFSYAWDDSVFYSGQKSIRIFRSENDGNAVFLKQNINSFPRNKEVKFSAYIRTENVVSGSAIVVFRADDENNNFVAFASTQHHEQINSTRQWRKYTVRANIPDNAEYFHIWLLHTGDGTVWFDKVSLTYEE